MLDSILKVLGNVVKEPINFFRNKTALAIGYPDWKQRGITVDVVNRSIRFAEEVRVLLTVEDSELNIGTKNVDIQMEILRGKISHPFKSHLNPSKIENDQVCFAERDLQGRNFQTVNIAPRGKRTADLMQVDLVRGYLDVASELGFSTNGGQSRSLLMPQKCYVGIITLESKVSPPRKFPVLFLPFEQQRPLREFGGYSFYKMLRDRGIFFGPLQWEELLELSVRASNAKRVLSQSTGTENPNTEEGFKIYSAKEAALTSVLHGKNGGGRRIQSLLDAASIAEIRFEQDDFLRNVAEALTSFEDLWNVSGPTFERTMSRRQLNDEILDHLKETSWPDNVINALNAIKSRVFEGG